MHRLHPVLNFHVGNIPSRVSTGAQSVSWVRSPDGVIPGSISHLLYAVPVATCDFGLKFSQIAGILWLYP